MNFATVKKLADIPWGWMRDLFSWEANGLIEAENKNLLVARATNTNGETLGFVTAEPILLVGSYIPNPNFTPGEVATMADPIDAALAQQANVSRIWMIVPPEAPPIRGEKRLRIVERKVYPGTTPQLSYEIKQQIAFLN
jgi:hypothetical protein